MTELEKLNNGEYYSMDDPEIAKIHYRAATLCQQFNALPITESEEREKVLRQLFGSAGKNLSIKPGFFCDLGINLHVGDNFLTNYNVTILDMARAWGFMPWHIQWKQPGVWTGSALPNR